VCDAQHLLESRPKRGSSEHVADGNRRDNEAQQVAECEPQTINGKGREKRSVN
jgi:hypothetical protein